jgi:hypothetical protein
MKKQTFPVTRPMRDAFHANPIIVLYRVVIIPRAKKDAAKLAITNSKKGYLAVISSDAQSKDGNGMGYTKDKRQRQSVQV